MNAATVLGSGPLIGIVRFHEGGDVAGAVEALTRGGIELLEITIDTPGALAAVERAAAAGRTVGVGTIVSAEQVDASAAAGARFVVSPGLSVEVIERAHDLGLEPIPGVFTATELLAATAAGARVMKLFPAYDQIDLVVGRKELHHARAGRGRGQDLGRGEDARHGLEAELECGLDHLGTSPD